MVDIARLRWLSDSSDIRSSTEDMDRLRGSANSLTGAATAVAGAIAAIGAGFSLNEALGQIGGFEDALAQVQTVTQATAADLAALEEQSRQLGATTTFSAQQAAEAQVALGRAGFETAQILEAIPSTLDLAAAGTLNLGRAADIASNALGAFVLPAEETGRVADVLAGTASRANTTVEQLAQALRTSGPVAASFGVSIEETSAAVATLSNAGLQAEVAGTGLRGVLASLADPSETLAAALGDVSVESDGLSSVLEQLRSVGLSSAEALEAFGREAAPAALVLIEGAEATGSLTEELSELEGEASRLAQGAISDLTRSQREAASAGQELVLVLGESGLTEAATNSFNAVAEFARSDFAVSFATGLGEAFAFASENAGDLAIVLGAVATALAPYATITAGVVAGVTALVGAFGEAEDELVTYREELVAATDEATALERRQAELARTAGQTEAIRTAAGDIEGLGNSAETSAGQVRTLADRVAELANAELQRAIASAAGDTIDKEIARGQLVVENTREIIELEKERTQALRERQRLLELADENGIALGREQQAVLQGLANDSAAAEAQIARLNAENDRLIEGGREASAEFAELVETTTAQFEAAGSAATTTKELARSTVDLGGAASDAAEATDDLADAQTSLGEIIDFSLPAVEQQVESTREAQREQARLREEVARFEAQPLVNALEDVQRTLTDTFEDALSGSLESLEDFGDAFLGIVSRLGANLLSQSIVIPITAAAGSAVGISPQQLGIPEGVAGVTDGGTGFDLASGLSGLTSALGTNTTAINAVNAVFGAGGAPQLANFAGGAFSGAGILGGLVGNFGADLLFGGDRGIGADIGGAAGGALGAGGAAVVAPLLGQAAGPIGLALGGLLGAFGGNALGGLFGPAPPSNAVASLVDLEEGTQRFVDPDGESTEQTRSEAQQLATTAAGLAQALEQATGAAFGFERIAADIGNRDRVLRISNPVEGGTQRFDTSLENEGDLTTGVIDAFLATAGDLNDEFRTALEQARGGSVDEVNELLGVIDASRQITDQLAALDAEGVSPLQQALDRALGPLRQARDAIEAQGLSTADANELIDRTTESIEGNFVAGLERANRAANDLGFLDQIGDQVAGFTQQFASAEDLSEGGERAAALISDTLTANLEPALAELSSGELAQLEEFLRETSDGSQAYAVALDAVDEAQRNALASAEILGPQFQEIADALSDAERATARVSFEGIFGEANIDDQLVASNVAAFEDLADVLRSLPDSVERGSAEAEALGTEILDIAAGLGEGAVEAAGFASNADVANAALRILSGELDAVEGAARETSDAVEEFTGSLIDSAQQIEGFRVQFEDIFGPATAEQLATAAGLGAEFVDVFEAAVNDAILPGTAAAADLGAEIEALTETEEARSSALSILSELLADNAAQAEAAAQAEDELAARRAQAAEEAQRAAEAEAAALAEFDALTSSILLSLDTGLAGAITEIDAIAQDTIAVINDTAQDTISSIEQSAAATIDALVQSFEQQIADAERQAEAASSAAEIAAGVISDAEASQGALEALAVAQEAFNESAAAAQAGDLSAFSEFASDANELLNAAAEVFAPGTAEFESIASQVQGAAAAAEEEALRIEQSQLEEAERLRDQQASEVASAEAQRDEQIAAVVEGTDAQVAAVLEGAERQEQALREQTDVIRQEIGRLVEQGLSSQAVLESIRQVLEQSGDFSEQTLREIEELVRTAKFSADAA